MLAQDWDLIVIGGGITGAGVFREASLRGYRVLLLEQRDFAFGASSRSGKLVHGGLRYLKQGQLHLTVESVREREFLCRTEPGLVQRHQIILPVRRGDPTGKELLGLGLWLYDLVATACTSRPRPRHRYLSRAALHLLVPGLRPAGLQGGFQYQDAKTDDCRLVLRMIESGIGSGSGSVALNYAPVLALLRVSGGAATGQPAVCGVAFLDERTGRTAEVQAKAVINATGPWADTVRGWLGRPPRLRPLRGSHLLFGVGRFPLEQAVNMFHPSDGRPLYAFPWHGAVLVGTTDLDHGRELSEEPRIAPDEVDYLLSALRVYFPDLDLNERDAVSSFAGVRPVIGTGKTEPWKESREHVVWEEDGLVTVTGGKLTTFRLLARGALRVAQARLGEPSRPKASGTPPAPVTPSPSPPPPDTAVVHLDDLMLRRTRLGLLHPDGGASLLPGIRARYQAALGWDDRRWESEERRYIDLWQAFYSPSAARTRS